MRFSSEEIEQARRLRELGLAWKPRAGHYVYDLTGFCKAPSPFQERIYFVLNYDYFIGRAGGVERFKQMMMWLPTWSDARDILELRGVSNSQVTRELADKRSLESRRELLDLYAMIARSLAATGGLEESVAPELTSWAGSQGQV